jgi:tRNA(adenine34) deaminase
MSAVDSRLMRRCFELASAAVARKELPFGCVIARDGEEISAEANGVREARDVLRHAEVCAIVAAQTALGLPSLEGCTLYSNIEPCAFCSYAIRESRIARVVYALSSPVMGGATRWDVLQDEGLSRMLPEVFTPPPEVVAGFMAEEADALLRKVAPMMWLTSRARGLFVCDAAGEPDRAPARRRGLIGAVKDGAMALLRRRFFDRFSRGVA